MTNDTAPNSPSKNEVIALDDVRQSRREQLMSKLCSAKTSLAPKTVLNGVTEEQKQKLRNAATKASQFTKDNKYSIGGASAALLAVGAGLFLWSRKRGADTAHAPASIEDINESEPVL